MFNILTGSISPKSISITVVMNGTTKIDLGLFNKKEATDLYVSLSGNVDYLKYRIDKMNNVDNVVEQ